MISACSRADSAALVLHIAPRYPTTHVLSLKGDLAIVAFRRLSWLSKAGRDKQRRCNAGVDPERHSDTGAAWAQDKTGEPWSYIVFKRF